MAHHDGMNDLEEIRAALMAMGRRRWEEVADKSGVPFSTIKKFAYGQVSDPAYSTVTAIKAVLPEVTVAVS